MQTTIYKARANFWREFLEQEDGPTPVPGQGSQPAAYRDALGLQDEAGYVPGR